MRWIRRGSMSSMSNSPKNNPLPFFGESEDAIRRQIERARAFIRASEEYLEKLSGIRESVVFQISHNRRYSEMRPIDAAVKMLKEIQRAIKRDEMEKELADGGVKTGQYREKSISQGIGAGLNSGTIVEKNGKIGLPDWSEEKFN
jgi:hypothetical protein